MSRLENFINNEQFNHYIGYIQEYMNNYSNQQVAYYETIINTKNSAFNETDFNQLDIADPVMINCLVSIETKENKETYVLPIQHGNIKWKNNKFS